MTRAWRSVVALSGGVGGARLMHGLSRVLDADAVTMIVNTGDDFEHWGLAISPDLDTVMYTLADLAPEERGWGLADETFHAFDRMAAYGEDAWFQLGDRDLATHLARTRGLRNGESLTAVTARLCRALAVRCRVLPMSDAPCRTMIETADQGVLPFQTWFVRHRAGPAVRAVRFDGAASPAPGVLEAIAGAELVVIGPSNPYVSVDPMLSLPGFREALAARPVVGVSPIVHGEAVKGPLAAMIPSLAARAPTAGAIAAHYGGLLRGFVVEAGDEGTVEGVPTLGTRTRMTTRADSARLAGEVLAFAEALC